MAWVTLNSPMAVPAVSVAVPVVYAIPAVSAVQTIYAVPALSAALQTLN